MRPHVRPQPIQPGAAQPAVVFSGLLAVAIVYWAMDPYSWQDLYDREVAIPRMQESHGFSWGEVSFTCPMTPQTNLGVVSVVPDGRFSRLGLRAGDVPFTRHGRGYAALHYALQAAARGNFSEVDVVNANDCADGKGGFRTVSLHPQIHRRPVALAVGVLRSPEAVRALEVWPVREEGPYGLWLIDLVDGGRRALGSYTDYARATWSSDERWLAVTDDPILEPSRCMLFDVQAQTKVELLEKLASLPVAARPGPPDDRIECDIVGWVRDEPSRVALTAFNFAAARGQRWRFDYYFDVTAGRLIPAGSQ